MLSPASLRTFEAFLEKQAVRFESRYGPWMTDAAAIAGAATLRLIARELRALREGSLPR